MIPEEGVMSNIPCARVAGSTSDGISRRAAQARFTDGIEVVKYEDYGWVFSGISRLFSLADLGRYLDNTDMTGACRALTPSHNEPARRHLEAVARTIYTKEYLGFDSIARFYDHLRVDHKLRRAAGLADDWLVDSRVIAMAYSELHMAGALDVIDAQVKADPELAKFRRRGMVAHRPRPARAGPANRRPGACEFCERETTGRGIAKHLGNCEERAAAARLADGGYALRPEYLIHVRVESSGYWLELEVRASSPLREVAVDSQWRRTRGENRCEGGEFPLRDTHGCEHAGSRPERGEAAGSGHAGSPVRGRAARRGRAT